MPWRLILFAGVFALFLLFIGFNLGPKYECDINFGFTILPEVPVFFTIFVSFAFGFICATPLLLYIKNKKKAVTSKKDRKQTDDTPSPPALTDAEIDEKIKQDMASARERFLANRGGGKK
jgi:hypothetical protein